MTLEMDYMVSTFEISLLKTTGEFANVMKAIETKDMAALVRAGSRTLEECDMKSKILSLSEYKSAEESNKARRHGNVHYGTKNFKDALKCYYKALACAPNKSVELKLAYSNISAVLFSIKANEACRLNINAALESDCPEFLRTKLENRLIEAGKCCIIDGIFNLMLWDSGSYNYANFEVARSSEIPCASKAVRVEGGKVVAAKKIRSGTMVALERAFTSNQDINAKYTSCYYCHRMCFFLIPCEGCCKALFCSTECREKCLEEYHRIECHVVGSLYTDRNDINQELNKLAIKAAIKMSLKLGWEKLRVASLEMGEKLFKKSSVAEAYDCNNPTSLLCYDDNERVPVKVMINKGLFCASFLLLIRSLPNYWPKGKKEKEQAIDSLSRIILHLNTTFSHQIPIKCSAIDYETENKMCCINEAQRNIGWFSFTSKLAHSCEPNLLVVGFNDHVGLVALQRIKKGEPLTISYIAHFYDMTIPQKNMRTRQHIIYNAINYQCKCRVCLLEWSDRSQVPIKLTDRQKAAYKQYKSVMISALNCSFKQKMEAIGVALDELDGCINTTKHFEAYEDLKGTLNISQCANDLNRRYKCQKTHVFLLEE